MLGIFSNNEKRIFIVITQSDSIYRVIIQGKIMSIGQLKGSNANFEHDDIGGFMDPIKNKLLEDGNGLRVGNIILGSGNPLQRTSPIKEIYEINDEPKF